MEANRINFYEILGVDRESSVGEIKRAYRKLCLVIIEFPLRFKYQSF